MESTRGTTTPCPLCCSNVSKDHRARHERTLKHLRCWAVHEGIRDHLSMTAEKLLEIKAKLDSGLRDYGVYTLGRLRQLADEKGLDKVEDLPLEKLCKRLHKVEDYGNTKLHIFNLERICEEARKYRLPTLNKGKEQLISQIYEKRGLHFCSPCKVAVQERELHEATPEHCIKIGAGLEEVVELTKTKKFRTVVINNISGEAMDIKHFLESIRPKVLRFLDGHSRENMKVFMTLECTYRRELVVSGHQLTTMSFHTKLQTVYVGDDLPLVITAHFEDLSSKESQHQPNAGSGWSLHNVKRLIVRKASFSPLSASSYINLPKWVRDKHACINIKNVGDRLCFIYSVLCALEIPPIHPERTYHYTSRLNDEIFQGFEYPMAIGDIPKFEARRQIGYPSMAINVFEIGPKGKRKKPKNPPDSIVLKDDIRPVLISKNNRTAEKIIDLLLINDDEKRHYVVIKDLCRLIRSQITGHRRRLFLCRHCLSHYHSQDHLDKHWEYCGAHDPCAMIMPPRGSVVRFRKQVNKFPHPYVVYADFETMGVKHGQHVGENTERIRKHVPYGFAIYVVSRINDEKFEPIVFRAKTPEQLKRTPTIFIKKLHKIVVGIAEKYAHPHPLIMTQTDEDKFQAATICHICEQPFNDGDIKVRDHSHLEGGFLGAAHQACNLRRCLITNIPVILHNMSRFDSHLFVEALFKYNGNSKMTVIPTTEETYITIQKNLFPVSELKGSKYFKLSFIDSFRFLNSSIGKLANNLERDQFGHLNHFIHNGLQKYMGINKSRAFQLLRGKGIFPYDFIDSLEKLQQTSLLGREHFRDSLNDEEISDSDYYRYKFSWYSLRNKSLGKYSDLYNIQDVLLLADIFENFRDLCLANYKLDPAYYLTAPSLAWDAMLKMTGSRIALISDPDMHLMIEGGIRGGIAQVCKRHVKANNRYLDDYDPSKPDNFLMYFDACNLYGWALSQKLPYNKFNWVRRCPTSRGWEDFITNHNENGGLGYFMEVDLAYPKTVHDAHKDLPFAPVHYKNKLCTTLYNKTKYIVHINNLKQMLANGLKLMDVHRVIGFRQTRFMKKYIEFNSQKRKHSRNEFEKQFYKNMVNSVFGRTMMNLRKRQEVKLCTEAQAHKLCKKPSFSRWSVFNDDFLACHIARNCIYFNQPIQVGCAVLEISKFLMYDFMYQKLKIWDPEMNLVLMDTDSYLVELSRDPYDIIDKNRDYFDTSNYPQSEAYPHHKLYSDKYKNFPGKMKDELGGIPMREVFGLRAKLYYYDYFNKNENAEHSEVRAKGVKKCVAKNFIGKEHFERALFLHQDHYAFQSNMRSEKHIIYTERQKKLALSGDDDKRFILPNGVDTLPWGHYSSFDSENVDLESTGNAVIDLMDFD